MWDGLLQVELLQHRGVQHSELSYPLSLAIESKEDGRSATFKEGRLVDLFDEIAILLARVISDFEVDGLSSTETLLVCDKGNTEHSQNPVK